MELPDIFINSMDFSTFTVQELTLLRNTVIKELDRRLSENESLATKFKSLFKPDETDESVVISNIYGVGDNNFDKAGNYIGNEDKNIATFRDICPSEDNEEVVDELTNFGSIHWIVKVKSPQISRFYVNFVDSDVAKLIKNRVI